MIAKVIPINSGVDDAWEAYAALARKLSTNPELIADRSYNEVMARAHERWRKLFIMGDRP